MMKLTKRILAFVLVLCTVAAWMIPGVSAAEQDMTVDFSSDITTLGMSGFLHTIADNVTKLENGYGTTNMWKVYKDSEGNGVYKGAYAKRPAVYGGTGINVAAAAGASMYVPFEFVAPATGDYTLSLTACYNSNGAAAGAYILEIPAEGFTSSNLPAESSDAVLVHTSVAVASVGNNSTKVTFDGSERVSLDANKKYVIVLYYTAGTADGYIRMSAFTLNYQEPIVLKTDNLTVNFGNAEEAPAGTYFSWGAQAPVSTVEAGFSSGTYKWKFYKNNSGTYLTRNYISASSGNSQVANYNGASNAGLQLNVYRDAASLIPIEFAVPGTGDYKLAVTFAAKGTNGGDLTRAGAYIVEIPDEGFENTAALPQPGDEGAQAMATVAGNGSAVSSTTVKLDQSKRYLVVFFGEGTGAYIRASSFTLTYQEPIVLKTDDLAVGFGDANVAGGFFYSWSAAQANANTITAGYPTTYKWKPYVNDAGTLVFRSLASNGNNNIQYAGGSTGGLTMQIGASDYSYLPIEFEAPGTGDYALSAQFNFGSNCVEAGAYILDITDGRFADIASMPKQDDAKAQAVVTLDGVDNSTNKVEGNGATPVTLDQTKSYVIVFYAKGSAAGSVRVTDFNLTYRRPVATIGAAEYFSIEEAVVAAAEGATIQIIRNTKVFGDLELTAKNLTLDLNGFDVNAGRNLVIGNVKDSKDGTGFLFCSIESTIDTAEDQMALWGAKDGVNGYSIYDVELKSYEAEVNENTDGTTARTFWVSVDFTNKAAYNMISINGNVLKINLDIQWTNSEGKVSAKKFTFDNTIKESWAAAQAASDTTWGVYVRVSGFETLGETGTLTAIPSISDATNSNPITGKTMTATYEHTVVDAQ